MATCKWEDSIIPMIAVIITNKNAMLTFALKLTNLHVTLSIISSHVILINQAIQTFYVQSFINLRVIHPTMIMGMLACDIIKHRIREASKYGCNFYVHKISS